MLRYYEEPDRFLALLVSRLSEFVMNCRDKRCV